MIFNDLHSSQKYYENLKVNMDGLDTKFNEQNEYIKQDKDKAQIQHRRRALFYTITVVLLLTLDLTLQIAVFNKLVNTVITHVIIFAIFLTLQIGLIVLVSMALT